jgi:hypothetical protein
MTLLADEQRTRRKPPRHHRDSEEAVKADKHGIGAGRDPNTVDARVAHVGHLKYP